MYLCWTTGHKRVAILSKELFSPVIVWGFSVPFSSPQAQMEEFRQLKEALQKMPSFKGGGGAGKGQQQFQVPKEQPMVPANSQLQLTRQKVWYSQKTPGRRVLQGFCGF